jgi:hypothetical protein
MRALLLFHCRVGARIAAQSFAPLFCTILALIMLNVDPAGMVIGLAMGLYGLPSSTFMLAAVAGLALFMSIRAAPRVTQGLSGWIRHLPVPSQANRRMAATALLVAQAPLAISLGILAIVAAGQGAPRLWPGLFRAVLLVIAASAAAMPVRRRWIAAPLSLAALAMVFGPLYLLAPAALALVLADLVSGPLRRIRRQSHFWSVPGALLTFWIAWRALRWRILPPYGAALLVLGGTLIFLENNALPGSIETGATRFGACFALMLFYSRMAQRLAVRRPAWHFARSLPWSSSSRIVADAVLMSSHSIPVLILIAALDAAILPVVSAAVPYLVLRIVGYIRIIPENRVAAGVFLLEGFLVAGSVALLPWTALLWLAGAIPAYSAARTHEQNQRVSRWCELHHASAGDTLIWSK